MGVLLQSPLLLKFDTVLIDFLILLILLQLSATKKEYLSGRK